MGRTTKKGKAAKPTEDEEEDAETTTTNDGAEKTNDTKNEFEGKNFYEVLGVSPTATEQEIKIAYRKKALEVHPDRNQGDPNATAKFQMLGKIYSTLIDEEKRKVYDQTGETDDSEFIRDGVDWEDYWRQLFKKVETSDIADYLKKYKFSAEEQEDLKKAYESAKGNIDVMLDKYMHGDETDRERYINDIQKYIDSEELEEYPAFTKSKKKKAPSKKRAAKKEQEAKEAEEMMKEIQEKNEKKGKGKKGEVDDLDSLAKQIQARGNVRFNNLFAKYGVTNDPMDEPPEEAFQQTREKMERNKKRQADKGTGSPTTAKSTKKVKKTV